MRVCNTPGCPTLIPPTARGGRCPTHRHTHEQQRGTPEQRGYGTTHRKLRATYQQHMNNGTKFRCWRCDTPIDPTNWQLGHDDNDRSQHRGPECPPCNLATAARRPHM